MDSLTYTEKAKLEKLFAMSSGYVIESNDTTFGHFFADEIGVDIHSQKYCSAGTSKAKKLRQFWDIEPDFLVGKALTALIKHVEENLSSFPQADPDPEKQKQIERCKKIATRLLSGKVNLDHLKETATIFDATHLADQIRRIEQSIESDPALAIGTAKELVETCCKTILAERGKPVTGTPDMPALTKETLKELKLVPEGIHEATRGSDIIKRLLSNLGTIGNGLAELRGLYGTGHGKHGKTSALSARHAKLAVGAATTLATFLFDTHKETVREVP
jgi:Abortive infection C-terminus